MKNENRANRPADRGRRKFIRDVAGLAGLAGVGAVASVVGWHGSGRTQARPRGGSPTAAAPEPSASPVLTASTPITPPSEHLCRATQGESYIVHGGETLLVDAPMTLSRVDLRGGRIVITGGGDVTIGKFSKT